MDVDFYLKMILIFVAFFLCFRFRDENRKNK